MASAPSSTPATVSTTGTSAAAASNRHSAPAGTTYTSIEQAGTAQLRHDSSPFLTGNGSGMLPAVFVNIYTEKRNAAGDISPRVGLSATAGSFIGVKNNASGEQAEMRFFHALDKYARSDAQYMFGGSTFREQQWLPRLQVF